VRQGLIYPTDYPSITVVTPSLNQGDFIDQTIRSVLGQDYPWLEYIVVDGVSTDNTLEILKKYSDRMIWISEKDRGQSNAINKGLRMAGGEVVAYLNSDDVYQPGALLKVGEFFASQPEAAWLTGKCRIIDQEGVEIRKGVTLYKNFWLRVNSYQALCVLDFISQPATFWRREVIDEIGEFNEHLEYAMDYDYSLRVGKKFKLWVLDEYLASFRVHPSSKAGSSARAQFEVDYQIAKKYSASKFLQSLHKIHNSIIVGTYRRLLWNSHQETMTKSEI
jgi:glycosyltransferase involved in cell wall biosynthesis